MAGSIVILALLSVCHLAIGSGPIIKTRFGVIEGWEGVSRNGRPYEAWTKIPYALPPVGQLRFQAPQPAKPWNGTYNGTSLTPACMQSLPPTQADQPPSESTGMMFEESPPEPVPVTVVTEDCLYLDVYRSKGLNKTNVPVLVYLPGDLSTGHVGDKHSADFLMDEDIILVQVNYRVGGLGFMSLGSQVMPGNYGLKDQVLALKWVNATIRDFGGNPKSVTVFGETSPHYLMKSRLSQNLVARAVSHSGTVNQGSTLLNGNIVKNNTANVARQLNCLKKTHQEILKCLQNVDSDKILSAIQLLTESSDPLQVLFAPVVEPNAVKQAFALQDILVRPSKKPWMHSFSNGEYQVYLAILKEKLDYVDSVRANVTIYLENWLKNRVTDPIKLQNGVAILQKKYFSVRSSVHAFAKELAKFHADANFIYPSIFHMKRHTGSKYLAELEYSSSISPLSPILYIAGHAAHTDYYFNRTDIGSLSPKYEDVSKRLIKYLVNFASNGKPTPKRATVNWKPFKTDQILRINGATDFIGDKTFFTQFQTIHDLWYSIIGRN